VTRKADSSLRRRWRSGFGRNDNRNRRREKASRALLGRTAEGGCPYMRSQLLQRCYCTLLLYFATVLCYCTSATLPAMKVTFMSL
jgi:hypothetical protein